MDGDRHLGGPALVGAGAQPVPDHLFPPRAASGRTFSGRSASTCRPCAAPLSTLPPEELNQVGFRLYERFRPEVPAGARGWGAKGVLYRATNRIRATC
ncbi:MAG: hypothetical protein JO326_01115 [Acetobacteraceae bacterium]|nr:hypothetical protein [Acetobacteraceae bacterium]